MKVTSPSVLIYGANGYSAKLITEELISRGIKPILSGRNESALKELSHKYDCEYRAVDLNDSEKFDSVLAGIHTVLNCAGPFKFTAKQIMEACLRCKCNYLDITGEIPSMYLAFFFISKSKRKRNCIHTKCGVRYYSHRLSCQEIKRTNVRCNTFEIRIFKQGRKNFSWYLVNNFRISWRNRKNTP